MAFLLLVALGQLLALVQSLLVGAFGLWTWVKVGLLTALLSLRAEVVATVKDLPILQTAADQVTVRWHFVPMLLTIGFLWLAAAAGVPVALLSAACSALVHLFLPALGLRLRVDVSAAALWAGVLAAAGAGTGAYLEAARGGTSAAVLRGGLAAYGWALGFLAVGVFVVATLEPTVTRDYVDGLTSLGEGGGVLFGYHVLAFPAQSALLFVPASGSCLEIIGESPILDLCPWRLVASGPAGDLFLPKPLSLSPWLWVLSVVPFVAALLGGRRAVTGAAVVGGRAAGAGVGAGLIFALLALLGGWFAAPELVAPLVPIPRFSMHPEWARTVVTVLAWGAGGGAVGGWLGGRRYEPELPRPTSA